MQKEAIHNACCTNHDPHYSMYKRLVCIWQWKIWNQTKKYFQNSQLKGLNRMRRIVYSHQLINRKYEKRSSDPSLKLESYIYRVPRWPLSYIGLFLFIFPKCPLEFLFSLFTIILENMKTLHIPHFCILHKIYFNFNSPNEN